MNIAALMERQIFYLNFHCSIMYLYEAALLLMFIALQEEILALLAVLEGSI